MKYLQHFGAAGTVTGSCHLLMDKDDRGLLVDFGMFQGTSQIMSMNYKYPSFNAQNIDNVLLTHAHFDHCGRLPLLAKMGFSGKVYMTKATYDLTEVVLYDSARIQQFESENGALYSEYEVEQILSQASIVDYDREYLVGNYAVQFKDAGHLLGSASIVVKDKTTNKRIVFSGDLGNTPDILLKPTDYIREGDVVVMESTYGDKPHPPDDPFLILQQEINEIERKKSVLLMPAFSLERTQVMLYMIKCLKRENKINPATQVYLDGPMGIKATGIYRKYPSLYNTNIVNEFKKGDPFSFPKLTSTRSGGQSRKIHMAPDPKIIIAGSGMMTGGRILGHALNYLADANNSLLLVGYQGEETLGREIKEGATHVQIDGTTVPVNAKVSEINNLSAHADQPKLLKWFGEIKGAQKVVLIHGEDGGPRETLASKIRTDFKIADVLLPQMEEVIVL